MVDNDPQTLSAVGEAFGKLDDDILELRHLHGTERNVGRITGTRLIRRPKGLPTSSR
jgi:hypothetical protein